MYKMPNIDSWKKNLNVSQILVLIEKGHSIVGVYGTTNNGSYFLNFGFNYSGLLPYFRGLKLICVEQNTVPGVQNSP